MDHKFQNQQRWLLLLLHARKCKPSRGKCLDRKCVTVRALLRHMNSCVEPQCLYPRCSHTKALISHYNNCKDLRCPVCVQVKTYLQQQANLRAMARLKIKSSTVNIAGSVSGVPHCDDTSDNLKLREDMRTLVFSELQKGSPCPATDASKYMDVTRSLEDGLYQMANTKEDYMNPSTLESRLSSLIKRIKLNDYDQIQQKSNSYPPGTMITTAPEVSAETTMEIEKVPENGDQLEMAEILMSMSTYR